MYGKRKTTEEFIQECIDKGIEYDMSKVDYKNARESVCVICPKHGEFYIRPDNLLHGKGCKLCSIEKNASKRRKSTEEFKSEVENKYPNTFDLSNVKYVDAITKVSIICHEKDINGIEHGEYYITPDHLLNGQGCPKCHREPYRKYIKTIEEQNIELIDYDSNNRCPILSLKCKIHDNVFRIRTRDFNKNKLLCPICHKQYDFEVEKECFIKKSQIKHNYYYTYDNVEFNGYNTKVNITCPIHGDFMQNPYSHLIKGQGCPECANDKRKLTQNEFMEKIKTLPNNGYDFSKVKYEKSNKKVCVICPKHGDFYITPNNILKGKGCPKCAGRYKTNNDIITEFISVHGKKYDYSKVEYEKANKKVCIICPEHGEFWQTPNKHLRGRGCPECKESFLERNVALFLKQHKIKYIKEYTKKEVIGRKRCDFFIPIYNVVIECQGKQHIGYIEGWNTEECYNKLVCRDIEKYYNLLEYGIYTYYLFVEGILNDSIFTNETFKGIYNNNNTFTDINQLFEFIESNHGKEKEG